MQLQHWRFSGRIFTCHVGGLGIDKSTEPHVEAKYSCSHHLPSLNNSRCCPSPQDMELLSNASHRTIKLSTSNTPLGDSNRNGLHMALLSDTAFYQNTALPMVIQRGPCFDVQLFSHMRNQNIAFQGWRMGWEVSRYQSKSSYRESNRLS